MKMRIAGAMVALALVLLPLGAWLLVDRSFDLIMEHERTRALSEEAAIARAVSVEIRDGAKEKLYEVASQIQQWYGSKTLHIFLIYHGVPMVNMTLPEVEGMENLLAIPGRATLLDGDKQLLCIAHDLNNDLMLLTVSDVSELYTLRKRLHLWAGVTSLVGIMLTAVLAGMLSEWLARPYQQLAQQRQDLIDAMAHEMRTPLTAILGGIRLLERAKLDEEQREKLLIMMGQETQRMSNMDERLLMLTQLEHHQMSITQFSSMKMAQEALAVFENVQISGEDVLVVGERELLIELMRNLVVNAQRAGGNVPVKVRMTRQGFTVEDRGCGMTKEQLAHAFEPFYRGDRSRSREAGGAGLGLALCARIAKLHGGEVRIESQIGQGTVVTFTMGKNVYNMDTSC